MDAIPLAALAVIACAMPAALAQEFPEIGIGIETVAENLSVPWEIAFAPDGRIFFTERAGHLRIIQDDMVLPEPAISIKVSGTEGGLLGLALDPDFGLNGHTYLYYSYEEWGNIQNRIVRYTERDNTLHDEVIILDGIPGSRWHDGGRIKFGPDGALYVTTGDAANKQLAQDPGSLAGKILRINSDGSIPDDNPFAGSAVYSLGHRNPQGLDWHPVSGELLVSEHGPSGERGVAHDEINAIYAGGNYGWPVTVGDETAEGMQNPLIHTGMDTWAPSGAAFYTSNEIEGWYGKFFVATLRGVHLRMLDVDGGKIESTGLLHGEFGRLRNAAMGPDGHLYLMTGNSDGRGTPFEGDDKILRIVPLDADRQDLSPLQQSRMGTEPHNILCRENLELVIRAGGEPACVREQTVQRLLEAGWARGT